MSANRQLAFVQKVAEHGIVGGLQSTAEGGRFFSGFLSAAVPEGASLGTGNYEGWNTGEKIVAAGVIGGTASQLGGGKFGNGALTGAFGEAFNEGAHAVKYQLALRKYASVIQYGHVDMEADARLAKSMSVGEFIQAVRTGGIWDYKDSSRFDGFPDKSLLAEFGNFHFGFVAHANGLPLGIAIAGAGAYQVFFQSHDASNVINFAGSAAVFGLPYVLSNSYASAMYNDFGVRFGDNQDDTPVIISGYEAYGN